MINSDIFNQYKFCIFNNPGSSATKSHDVLRISARNTTCKGRFLLNWRAIDTECLKSSLRVDLPTMRRPAFSGLLDIFEIAVVSL